MYLYIASTPVHGTLTLQSTWYRRALVTETAAWLLIVTINTMVDTTDMLQQCSGALLAVIPVSAASAGASGGARCDRK